MLSISASDISSAHSLDGLEKKQNKTQMLLCDKEVDGWNNRKAGFYTIEYLGIKVWITFRDNCSICRFQVFKLVNGTKNVPFLAGHVA